MPTPMVVSRRRFLALSGTAATLTVAATRPKPHPTAKTLSDHGAATDQLGSLSAPPPPTGDAVTDRYLNNYGAYP